jgi:alkanesulfonate monooxygenase SsuD/methylene tetrahydromethanopterin reductase-like flavin-dependent oxidoreductase (luciferase family)
MKFGLLYEIQIPPPWSEGYEARAYAEAMEQIVLADELGWDYVWAVEHHMLPGWSHSSAPEVFFGALSQRTSRIRLGHGIALLPKNFNHPVRVAERTAVLDILSGGRVDLGTGRAVTLQELDGFQVEPDETQAQWAEGIEIVKRAWRDEPLSFDGTYYQIPERHVVPKPLQKPHPPLWLAGTNPETFAKAGRHGLGLLGFVTATPDEVEPRVAAYRAGIADPNPIGDFINDQVAVLMQTYCAETNAEALAVAEPAVTRSAELAAELFLPWAEPGATKNAASYQYLTEQSRTGAAAPESVAERARKGVLAIGTPDDLVETIKRYESMGVDQVMTWVQFGGLPHDKIMESMRLMGEQVLPKLQQTSGAPSGNPS